MLLHQEEKKKSNLQKNTKKEMSAILSDLFSFFGIRGYQMINSFQKVKNVHYKRFTSFKFEPQLNSRIADLSRVVKTIKGFLQLVIVLHIFNDLNLHFS